MQSSLYSSTDYRAYLVQELDSERFGRGSRSELAEFLGVQTSLVSLVLTKRQHFSLEQGIRIAEFLKLDSVETEFFMLLIEHNRAGSVALERHYERQIERIRKERAQVKKRVRADAKTLSSEELYEYYSTWFHIAVHMAVRNPEHRTPEKIANALGIELSFVKRSLQVLGRLGFIRSDTEGYRVTDRRFHIDAETPSVRVHHLNWRHQAVQSIDRARERDLHYSLVMSIDAEACAKIRAYLLEAIEKSDAEIARAKDARVFALNIDLFDVEKK